MAHCRLAWAYQLRERYADAIPEYELALQIKADYAYAHAGLGWAFFHLGRFQEALDSLQRASRMDPEYQNDSQHLIAIGQTQKEMGLFADAAVTLNESIRLDPGNAETFLQISVVYSELGNWESVLRSGRQYVELRPNEVTGLLGNFECSLGVREI